MCFSCICWFIVVHHIFKLLSDIMIGPQAVLSIPCSHDCFTIQNAKVGNGTLLKQITEVCKRFIRSPISLDKICMPNITIQGQVLQIFCSQGSKGFQCKSRERGITLQQQVRLRKKYGSACFSYLFYMYNFTILSLNSS